MFDFTNNIFGLKIVKDSAIIPRPAAEQPSIETKLNGKDIRFVTSKLFLKLTYLYIPNHDGFILHSTSQSITFSTELYTLDKVEMTECMSRWICLLCTSYIKTVPSNDAVTNNPPSRLKAKLFTWS